MPVRATGSLACALSAAVLAACAGTPNEGAHAGSSHNEAPSDPAASTSGSGATSTSPASSSDPSHQARDLFDVVLDGATADEVRVFNDGDLLFGTVLRDGDGLGPLYTQASCGACHTNGMRGPGSVQKMVVVDSDGTTPAADQSSLLPWGATVHPLVAGGGLTPIVPPSDARNVRLSIRVGPPVLGRGYMEAVLDSEIERMAAEQAQRDDGIRGRVNHVVYASEANPDTRFHAHQKGDHVVGRFGLKARIATIDDFTADAFQGDMGITSPLRPVEIANPDQRTDDAKPGVDVTADSVNMRANYIRLTAIPRRAVATDGVLALGTRAFVAAKCSGCHAPALATRGDYPIAAIAGRDARVYTDFLLHDMGDALADSLGGEGEAGPRDWRTAPLVGLRFARNFMHDGRAPTVGAAVDAHDSHGSEAAGSVALVRALSQEDRAALFAFVLTL